MNSILDIELAKQLTPGLNCDERMKRLFVAIDRELKEIAQKQRNLYLIANIDVLPEKIINLLAWQWHVDFWNDEMKLQRKRYLVKNSIQWHRIKGTPAAVEEVVRAAYGNCELTEWFEYGGEPYFFRVSVTLEEESTDKSRWKNVIEAINSAKNMRSWLEKILFYYPDIRMPILIYHRAESVQFVEARHRVWNLGSARSARRDGEFLRDGMIRRTGKHPVGQYREKQAHRLEVDMQVDATMNGSRVVNRRDGTYCRDGSHRRNGAYETGRMVSHCCAVTYAKNEIEVIEYV